MGARAADRKQTKAAPFPEGFLWGAATSAYQIEGSPLADGAGPSIWHRFVHQPGRIAHGDTGDVACDHYRRSEQDLALMEELGLNAYRLSLAWGRVLPEGRGAVNRAGLGFYDRLIDGLLARGIEPFVTLYHWDLPEALEERGGWLNRDSAGWFAEYARVAFEAFGDRVRYWVTLNEPAIITEKGYVQGVYAPGHRSVLEAPVVACNLLRAHAAAVDAYRAERRQQIGLVVNLQPKHPLTLRPEDVDAARRADAFRNRQFLDATLLGRWPAELAPMFGPAWDPRFEGDLASIRRPIDFIGVNYYTRNVMTADADALLLRARSVPQVVQRHTQMGWEVYPQGLSDTLYGIKRDYGDIPLYVTENGAAFEDRSEEEGGPVDDPERVAYLRDHLVAVRAALKGGVDVRGYFVWSLLDNFEWASGYGPRFGLVHVDHDTQRRTPRASARFYAKVIKSNGKALGR